MREPRPIRNETKGKARGVFLFFLFKRHDHDRTSFVGGILAGENADDLSVRKQRETEREREREGEKVISVTD